MSFPKSLTRESFVKAVMAPFTPLHLELDMIGFSPHLKRDLRLEANQNVTSCYYCHQENANSPLNTF